MSEPTHPWRRRLQEKAREEREDCLRFGVTTLAGQVAQVRADWFDLLDSILAGLERNPRGLIVVMLVVLVTAAAVAWGVDA